uniref:Uncharacterized protein n=1 Tax=Candidatus Kentrum sp. TC TaxID=2126339 RepID=A0A450Z1M8_9GAMM|nr:MAG: hypothetical protein BECKTC1821D_GA0114238_10505 [Candidatus Kentron sp. TC]VFK61105.1 MAG: hypothetical protein BECKTC1821F_GA0114240_105313 [Candidatus Kentron sp. TC]
MQESGKTGYIRSPLPGKFQGFGKIKIPKNRCLRKKYPVWILARSADMFNKISKRFFESRNIYL